MSICAKLLYLAQIGPQIFFYSTAKVRILNKMVPQVAFVGPWIFGDFIIAFDVMCTFIRRLTDFMTLKTTNKLTMPYQLKFSPKL